MSAHLFMKRYAEEEMHLICLYRPACPTAAYSQWPVPPSRVLLPRQARPSTSEASSDISIQAQSGATSARLKSSPSMAREARPFLPLSQQTPLPAGGYPPHTLPRSHSSHPSRPGSLYGHALSPIPPLTIMHTCK
ncbi:voltage-dependent calcium channel gamma-7 subunit [Lates japonicus]|uniref:Voltage-dependent calcium channel gamma-7 subunit n=1 Tax=Lates japonicus TaxID=270547 RepID=A0AAD3RK20_LATJO|nr:voltage-dependent calcium channel gamma-7 subunit [Lates japonicus]